MYLWDFISTDINVPWKGGDNRYIMTRHTGITTPSGIEEMSIP